MASRVRVPSTAMAFGGWKGTITIEGEALRVAGDDEAHSLEIDASVVKSFSFNSNNGLWAFRMQDGRKIYLQSAGGLLSADRSPAGRETNEQIAELLRKHGHRGLTI